MPNRIKEHLPTRARPILQPNPNAMSANPTHPPFMFISYVSCVRHDGTWCALKTQKNLHYASSQRLVWLSTMHADPCRRVAACADQPVSTRNKAASTKLHDTFTVYMSRLVKHRQMVYFTPYIVNCFPFFFLFC